MIGDELIQHAAACIGNDLSNRHAKIDESFRTDKKSHMCFQRRESDYPVG